MSKGQTFSNDILKLILQGTPIANLADNAASGPLSNLYLSLHTADPGATGNQTTSEVSYTNYARVAVARSSSGFTVPTTGVSNLVASMDFPSGGIGAAPVATYACIGIAASGTGKILYRGLLSASITCGSGVTPRLTTSSTVVET